MSKIYFLNSAFLRIPPSNFMTSMTFTTTSQFFMSYWRLLWFAGTLNLNREKFHKLQTQFYCDSWKITFLYIHSFVKMQLFFTDFYPQSTKYVLRQLSNFFIPVTTVYRCSVNALDLFQLTQPARRITENEFAICFNPAELRVMLVLECERFSARHDSVSLIFAVNYFSVYIR